MVQAFPRPDLCSLDRFRVAASWVASRSFHVDAWHGDAMVPLADIFNHKVVWCWAAGVEVAVSCRQRHTHERMQQMEDIK